MKLVYYCLVEYSHGISFRHALGPSSPQPGAQCDDPAFHRWMLPRPAFRSW